MSFEAEKAAVPKWALLVAAAAAVTIAVGVYYYNLADDSVKAIGLAGGIVSGLIVFLLTFISTIRPLQKLDSFERMGIKAVLSNRHEKAYYAKILSGAERTVSVMGASCTRFIEDFLDMQNDDHVLVDALRRRSGFM
jgi:hypothetical protein